MNKLVSTSQMNQTKIIFHFIYYDSIILLCLRFIDN
jgi:hypothetical protein